MVSNILLWDGQVWKDLLPFTFTRPAAEIRCGILTIAEKYAHYFGSTPSYLTEEYLQEKFPAHATDDNLIINAAVLPDEAFAAACYNLKQNESLWQGEQFLAARTIAPKVFDATALHSARVSYDGTVSLLDKPWKIFSLNEQELKKDFLLITKGRKSQPIPAGNFVKSPENIFIEEGASIENASLNASAGPIYIGKDAEVMEGSLVRGPFALGEHSTLKLGAKIYGATTIGPHCKVGGEVNNSVFFGYANKAHDGFVGNAVIGEWCNLGADSNNSNLKNNYEEVKVWSYAKNGFVKTGLQFCGLMMGDHSKCGINTMFNTGTVVGVSANIFGGGFPRNFIPSFSWGGASGFTTYQMNKALDTAEKVLARRSLPLTDTDKKIFDHIFQYTKEYRNF
jgi:UDP-N-acetylglucosamine diphosphorylase/glucosamine-1-phosphate N-acetyltransferase